MINYVVGNVFEQLNQPCAFAHGCNAQRVMGSGVAKVIKEQYPEVYQAYLGMDMKLGAVSYVKLESGVIMCNLISQKFYGKDSKRYVDYDAVYEGLLKVSLLAKLNKLPIKMPFIGGGLGGGNRSILEQIFEEALVENDVTIFLLESVHCS